MLLPTLSYLFSTVYRLLAERGGFEPPVELLTLQRFSKPPPSATRPSLLLSPDYTRSPTPPVAKLRKWWRGSTYSIAKPSFSRFRPMSPLAAEMNRRQGAFFALGGGNSLLHSHSCALPSNPPGGSSVFCRWSPPLITWFQAVPTPSRTFWAARVTPQPSSYCWCCPLSGACP